MSTLTINKRSRTRSLHVGKNLLDALGERAENNFSGAINASVVRYAEIIRQSMPIFSEAEWNAICNANSRPRKDDDYSLNVIWANVACSLGLDAKWGIDTDALVERLRALTYCQACAVADVIERFWYAGRFKARTNKELLIECGARIPAEASQPIKE